MKPARRLRDSFVEVPCTEGRLNEGALEGSRSLVKGFMEELRGIPTP